MASLFRFKRFSLSNERAALKVGTDAVLLGSAMSLRAQAGQRLLDIGTGGGVIALMAAQRLCDLGAESCRIDAVELDGPSAQEASENFANSPWAGGIECIRADFRDFAATAPHYDHIFSNPPFYDNSLLNPDPRKAPARHTRTLSYREICAFCSTNLAPQGRLSLVLPYEQREDLLRCAASYGLYPFRLMSIKTTERKPFRRLIAEFSFTRTQVEEQTLVLQDGDRRSAAYSELTRDFYL